MPAKGELSLLFSSKRCGNWGETQLQNQQALPYMSPKSVIGDMALKGPFLRILTAKPKQVHKNNVPWHNQGLSCSGFAISTRQASDNQGRSFSTGIVQSP